MFGERKWPSNFASCQCSWKLQILKSNLRVFKEVNTLEKKNYNPLHQGNKYHPATVMHVFLPFLCFLKYLKVANFSQTYGAVPPGLSRVVHTIEGNRRGVRGGRNLQYPSLRFKRLWLGA